MRIEVEWECGVDISIGTIFDPLGPPYPLTGVELDRPKLDIGIPVKRRQIKQNFVLRGMGKSGVGFRLVQLSTPSSPYPPNWAPPSKLQPVFSRWSNTLN